MSDGTVMPISLTAIARNRSTFTPMRALNLRVAEPVAVIDEYASGLADGEQIATAAFEVEKAALLALIASAQAFQPETGPELALLMHETVVRLVRQLCGSINIDTKFLNAQIAAAVAVITEADDARRIMLHPDDAALVGDTINALSVGLDPSLMRGAIRIDCSQGWIDHGVALGIERLRDLLGVPA